MPRGDVAAVGSGRALRGHHLGPAAQSRAGASSDSGWKIYIYIYIYACSTFQNIYIYNSIYLQYIYIYIKYIYIYTSYIYMGVFCMQPATDVCRTMFSRPRWRALRGRTATAPALRVRDAVRRPGRRARRSSRCAGQGGSFGRFFQMVNGL